MLEDLETDRIESSVREAMMANLDNPEARHQTRVLSRPLAVEGTDLRLPQPLRGYLGRGLDDLDWKLRGPVDEVRILPDHVGVTSRLFRIRAGTAMPRHTHDGSELTLVLTGGFTDRGNHFQRGDVAVADSSVDHCPVADPGEDCFCFAVNDAPLRLTGRFARLLNPFIRI